MINIAARSAFALVVGIAAGIVIPSIVALLGLGLVAGDELMRIALGG